MSAFGPTIEEERLLAAASLAGVSLPTSWSQTKPLVRATFFVLTLLGIAVLGLLISMFSGTNRFASNALLVAVVSIALGEFLIRRFSMFRTGPEEALWLTGSVAVALAIVESKSTLHYTVDFVIFGAAIAVAGIRLRNAFFVTCAMACALPLLVRSYGGAAAATCAVVVAVAALVLSMFEIRRPSSQAMLDVTMVVMPLAGFVAQQFDDLLDLRTRDRFDLGMTVMFLLLAVLFTVLGLRRRLHAALIAAMPCLGIVAWECRNLTGLSLEARLILWGGLLLAASLVTERVLRGRRSGITSDELEPSVHAPIIDLTLATAASVHVQTSPNEAPAHGLDGSSDGRGSFGGGGASGDY